jgi:hypothetical protein
MIPPSGNGSANGYHGAAMASRAMLRLLRRPTLALLRRYADWVERTSSLEVGGPGSSYAGSAVYVCRSNDAPLVFLHRAHYDDRMVLDPHPVQDAVALFAHAAGLVVSRSGETPPEVERSVRAGNGALFVVGGDEPWNRNLDRAAALALRTAAPVIPLSARATRLIRVPWLGASMGWPLARNRIVVTYGPLERLAGEPAQAAERIRALLRA